MARKKLSEFTAKTLLSRSLGLQYGGIPVVLPIGSDSEKEVRIENQELWKEILNQVQDDKLYVVKVDEGVKGRMKKGLVALKVAATEITEKIKEFTEKGYSRFLIEEFVPHEGSLERYFSIERTREGLVVYYSDKGGIDIESSQDQIHKVIIDPVILNEVKDLSLQEKEILRSTQNDKIKELTRVLGLEQRVFEKIIGFFDNQYLSFLEINPFIIHNSKFIILDLAVEVDSAAEFFVQNGWTAGDFVEGGKKEKTEEEKNIIALQANSQASLKMEILNPHGSIFVMLFGGGGSIVVADEIYNQGFAKELGNYGDYSGGPKEAETVIYVENLLKALLKSSAKKKVFLIAGTYANFTDVSVTFRGVITAMEHLREDLKKQNIKVFVRRPGPNQKKGLALIKAYLDKENMNGGVWDSSMIISDVVLKAIEYLRE